MGKNAYTHDEVVYAVCERFLKGANATEVKEDMAQTMNVTLTREAVYPLLVEAAVRGFVRLCPPEHSQLAQRLKDRFREAGRSIQVVNAGTPSNVDHVSTVAAETALQEIRRVSKKRDSVHVGLGAGWTTMTTARHLAQLLRSQSFGGKIVLHALSSGFDVRQPATSPVAFFSFFHGLENVSYRGLFASAYVETDRYEETKRFPGVRESFDEASAIDVIITSHASAHDPHGELTKFMETNHDEGPRGRAVLTANRWVGDVQYRPYSATGPIIADTGVRAVTLFELSDLVRLAETPDKAVILISGPCHGCKQSRSRALLPLLAEPSLRVWTHLVTDVRTASEVLEETA